MPRWTLADLLENINGVPAGKMTANRN